MKKLAVVVCILVMAASVNAVTVFENFDGSLASWTTVGTQISVSQVAGVVAGTKYLDVSMKYFGTAAKSRFTRGLGVGDISAGAASSTNVWLQFDVIFDTAVSTDSWTKTGTYGVMNAGDSKNEMNLFGDQLFFAFSTSSDPAASTRGNRNDLFVYGSDGTSQGIQQGVVGAAPDAYYYLDDKTTGYRVKTTLDGTSKVARQKVYAINANGSTGALVFETSTTWGLDAPLTVTKNFIFDEFGLANRTNSTKQVPQQGMIMDNYYASTDGALATEVAPSWIPEPATVALLGLGALVLRRRK